MNMGVGCNFFLQGIFPTQGANLLWQADSLPLCHLGSLLAKIHSLNKCLLSPYCVQGSGEKHSKTATVSPLKGNVYMGKAG